MIPAPFDVAGFGGLERIARFLDDRRQPAMTALAPCDVTGHLAPVRAAFPHPARQ